MVDLSLFLSPFLQQARRISLSAPSLSLSLSFFTVNFWDGQSQVKKRNDSNKGKAITAVCGCDILRSKISSRLYWAYVKLDSIFQGTGPSF
jgi:hypothetical protein